MQDVHLLQCGLDSIGKELEKAKSTLLLSSQLNLDSVGTAIGDVEGTLQRCTKLLSENQKFERDNEGYIRNIEWNLTVAQHVKNLQTRIIVHCSTVSKHQPGNEDD